LKVSLAVIIVLESVKNILKSPIVDSVSQISPKR
jgi:hypothetical protein